MAIRENSALYEVLVRANLPAFDIEGGVAVRYIDWIEKDGQIIHHAERPATPAELTSPEVIAVIGEAHAAAEAALAQAIAEVKALKAA